MTSLGYLIVNFLPLFRSIFFWHSESCRYCCCCSGVSGEECNHLECFFATSLFRKYKLSNKRTDNKITSGIILAVNANHRNWLEKRNGNNNCVVGDRQPGRRFRKLLTFCLEFHQVRCYVATTVVAAISGGAARSYFHEAIEFCGNEQ